MAVAIPSLFGIAAGIVSAWFTHRLRRDETAEQMKLVRAQVEKTLAEAEQIRTGTIKNLKAAATFTSAATSEQIIVDARQGFSGFDYAADPFGGADGQLTLMPDDALNNGILSLERRTTAGVFRIVFKAYAYGGATASYIPPGVAGSTRRIKAELEARALGTEHTVLLVLKDPDSKPGHHLAEWTQHLIPDAWTRVEAYFESAGGARCRFRIDDQSVAVAPTALQIRRLVLIEKER